MAMLNSTQHAPLSRPPVPYRGNDYQGTFTITAGQTIEIDATGQDNFELECPEGKVWTISVRLNIFQEDA